MIIVIGTLIPTWISKHTPSEVGKEITYEVCE